MSKKAGQTDGRAWQGETYRPDIERSQALPEGQSAPENCLLDKAGFSQVLEEPLQPLPFLGSDWVVL